MQVSLSVLTSSSLSPDLKAVKQSLQFPLIRFEDAKVELGKHCYTLSLSYSWFLMYCVCAIMCLDYHHHHHREVLTDRCAPPWPLATSDLHIVDNGLASASWMWLSHVWRGRPEGLVQVVDGFLPSWLFTMSWRAAFAGTLGSRRDYGELIMRSLQSNTNGALESPSTLQWSSHNALTLFIGVTTKIHFKHLWWPQQVIVSTWDEGVVVLLWYAMKWWWEMMYH